MDNRELWFKNDLGKLYLKILQTFLNILMTNILITPSLAKGMTVRKYKLIISITPKTSIN